MSIRVRKEHLHFGVGATAAACLAVVPVGAALPASARSTAPAGSVAHLAASSTSTPSAIIMVSHPDTAAQLVETAAGSTR
jgi:hypothetical protein